MPLDGFEEWFRASYPGEGPFSAKKEAAMAAWQARAELAVPAPKGTESYAETTFREVRDERDDLRQRVKELEWKLSAVPAPESPIRLNNQQENICKLWAEDDRLWTTQETVAFNLRTFARAILSAVSAEGGGMEIRDNYVSGAIPADMPAADHAQTLAYFNSREDLLAGRHEKEGK